MSWRDIHTQHTQTHTNTHTHIIYIYIHVYIYRKRGQLQPHSRLPEQHWVQEEAVEEEEGGACMEE